jgi:hypothetical protein
VNSVGDWRKHAQLSSASLDVSNSNIDVVSAKPVVIEKSEPGKIGLWLILGIGVLVLLAMAVSVVRGMKNEKGEV